MDKELKPWRCPNGHILGYVRRNGDGIRQLYLLREAVDPEEAEGAPPDVAGVIEGFMPSWRCSKCGMVRTWVPGQEALAEILRRMREETSSPAPPRGAERGERRK